MKKNKVKLIAFDLGYTLVYNAREEHYMDYLRKQNIDISRSEVDLAFHHADKTFMRYYIGALGHPPQYFFPWYLGVINYHLEQQFDLIEQSEYILNHRDKATFWKLFPWTKDVLVMLKDQGYRLALLSNWNSSCRDLLRRLKIYDYFDHILVSSEIGIEKPDQRIFEMLLDETEFESEEILYIGDNYYDDVQGSRKVDIETILINRFGSIGIEEINDCQVIQSTRELPTLLEDADLMTKILN